MVSFDAVLAAGSILRKETLSWDLTMVSFSLPFPFGKKMMPPASHIVMDLGEGIRLCRRPHGKALGQAH